MDQVLIDYLARWGHYLSGITWIGLLYYFNFVQTEYFKEADGMRERTHSSSWYHERCGGSVGVRCLRCSRDS